MYRERHKKRQPTPYLEEEEESEKVGEDAGCH